MCRVESRRMQLMLAKLNHMDDTAASQVIDAMIEKVNIWLSEREQELVSITTTLQHSSRTPQSALQL